MVTWNDYRLGLMNGDIGIVLEGVDNDKKGYTKGNLPEKALRVIFLMADGSIKKVLPSRLGAVETVYAMTAYKSQGSEFDHTALVMPDTMSPVLTRELIYTGITRARSFFTMAGTSTKILADTVEQRIIRASGLRNLLLKRYSIFPDRNLR